MSRTVVWLYLLLLLLSGPLFAAGTRESVEGEYDLDGSWLLAITADPISDRFPVDEIPECVQLPAPRFLLPPGGAHTIWLQREIPAHAFSGLSQPGIYIGRLPDYSRVFINGRLILISGSGPPDKYYSNMFFSHAILIPDDLIAGGESLNLTIRTYSRKNIITYGTMTVGEWKHVAPRARLESLVNRGQGLAVSAIGVLTFLYFMVIFIMEPDKSGRAFMAFASLGFAVNATILFVLRSPFSYLTMFKIQVFGLHIGVLGMVLFVQEFVEIHQRSWVRNLFIGGTVAALILIGSAGTIAQAVFLNDTVVYLGLTAPMLVYSIALGVVGIRRGLDARWALMAGIMIIVISAGRDVILASRGITPVVYTNLMGLTVFIVIIFLAYAANFVKARRTIAAQTAVLEQNIRTLELSEKQLLANERLALIGSLVAGVHHEVRTPIGNAMLAASFLQEESRRIQGELGQRALTLSSMKDYLDKSENGLAGVTESLARADRLLDNFRNSARDQMVEEKRCVSLEEYIPRVVESLAPRFTRSAVSLDMHLSHIPATRLLPGAVWQIISNLLLNTLAHAYPDGEEGNVSISAELDDESVVLRITDDGAGMSEEVRDRAFETFFTTRPTDGGTGLGLSIVKNLVEQSLGGEIRVHSRPGEGSMFEVRWPLDACPEQTQ